MQGYRAPLFGNLPPVIKNLLIINILVFAIDQMLSIKFDFNLGNWLALHNFQSEHFSPIQLVTYMFMHGNVSHIFFNMLALVMFGRVLEQVWGGKRFYVYYFVTGIGAALCQMCVLTLQTHSLMAAMSPEAVDLVMREGYNVLMEGKNYVDPNLGKLNLLLNTPTVGASGAVFGVLLAFGMMFPNVQLMLIFPPIPIRAKWFVLGYGLIELMAVIAPQANDNVAHLAHLGGMLFGFLLIKYWNKRIDPNQNIYF